MSQGEAKTASRRGGTDRGRKGGLKERCVYCWLFHSRSVSKQEKGRSVKAKTFLKASVQSRPGRSGGFPALRLPSSIWRQQRKEGREGMCVAMPTVHQQHHQNCPAWCHVGLHLLSLPDPGWVPQPSFHRRPIASSWHLELKDTVINLIHSCINALKKT